MEQCNKTCNDCKHFNFTIFEDSFGPYAEEYCDENQYGHVGYYSEPCKLFKDKRENTREV